MKPMLPKKACPLKRDIEQTPKGGEGKLLDTTRKHLEVAIKSKPIPKT